MKALLETNINNLKRFNAECGGIENYYQEFINEDESYHKLIKALAYPKNTDKSINKDKMVQMGIPLVCEYLRNAGHDIPKPDRHICRILGSEYLALSDKKCLHNGKLLISSVIWQKKQTDLPPKSTIFYGLTAQKVTAKFAR